MSRKAMKQESVAWTPQVWRQFSPDGTLEFQKIKRTPNGEWEDYTAPQRREWVGLTEEEREFLLHQALRFYDTNAQLLSFIKTVEEKLKEKNT